MKHFPSSCWFTQKKSVVLNPSTLQTWQLKTGDGIGSGATDSLRYSLGSKENDAAPCGPGQAPPQTEFSAFMLNIADFKNNEHTNWYFWQ
jgi:hypothetical protein